MFVKSKEKQIRFQVLFRSVQMNRNITVITVILLTLASVI